LNPLAHIHKTKHLTITKFGYVYEIELGIFLRHQCRKNTRKITKQLQQYFVTKIKLQHRNSS